MTGQVIVYHANPKICNACPVKSECTSSKSGRFIFRSFFQKELDKAEAYRQTEAYQKAMRKRSMWVEPLFGEAKEFHRLRRFRLRLLLRVNLEGVMVAAGQNLKRLIKRRLAVLFSLLLEQARKIMFSAQTGLFQQPAPFCILPLEVSFKLTPSSHLRECEPIDCQTIASVL